MLRWFSKKNKKKEKKERLNLSSKNKDALKKIFDLPVQDEWLDDETISKVLRDATVQSAMGSRKAATLKKEIVITCKNKDIKENLEKVFSYDTLDCILDTPYYGFNVFEINWDEKNNLLFPVLEDRDYKDFILDNKVLKFSPNGITEDIAKYKAIYTTYRAKATKPYGQPILNTLFWLIEFKNASLEFWVELLEKFGTPWVIGKTDGDKDAFADEIYNMLGGDGAVLERDDELEIITANEKGSYEKLISYIDDQIRQLILGGNLTGQVTQGSLAAANVHNEIREDLAQADENIVNKVIEEVIKNFKELNSVSEDIQGVLKDKDDPNKELADRDKVIADMGYTPTQEYIETTYNIKVEKKQTQEEKPVNASKTKDVNNLYALGKLPSDELEYQIQNIDTNTALTFQMQILEIIENCNSYEELKEELVKNFKDIDTKDFQEKLSDLLQNAHILASAQIEEENPNG